MLNNIYMLQLTEKTGTVKLKSHEYCNGQYKVFVSIMINDNI